MKLLAVLLLLLSQTACITIHKCEINLNCWSREQCALQAENGRYALTVTCTYYSNKEVYEQVWSSGMMKDFQSCDSGSIPGTCSISRED